MSRAASRGVPTPIEEGQVFDGTYRLVRFIGEGGMGRVFEATHARLAGRYAIKVLLHKLSTNPDAMARFNREARITSSLQHPNIVQVVDFNTTPDGTEYLVMEYLGGESLAARIARRGPQPVARVIEIVDQVAAGLAAAHGQGVIHRDLKPDNVFLVPVEGRTSEWAKILDFGISKARDNSQTPGGPVSAVLGTPLYMSPEQCQGRSREVDATTDQFALAAITYELLTGRAAFAGQTVGDVLAHVVHDDPPPMGLVDAEVESVVKRGLAKAQAARFPSVKAFSDALRAAATAPTHEVYEAGTVPYPVGGLAKPGIDKGPGRRNWVAVLVTAALIMAASSFAVRQARQRLGAPAKAEEERGVAPSGEGPADQVRLAPAVERAAATRLLDSVTGRSEGNSRQRSMDPESAPRPSRLPASPASPTVARSHPDVPSRAVRDPASTRRTGADGRPVDSVTGYPLGGDPARGATPPARVTRPQPSPRKSPLIIDDEATLPLDESIGDRAPPL